MISWFHLYGFLRFFFWADALSHQPCSQLSTTTLSAVVALQHDQEAPTWALQRLPASSWCFSTWGGIHKPSSRCPGKKCVEPSSSKHSPTRVLYLQASFKSCWIGNCGLWNVCYPWDLPRVEIQDFKYNYGKPSLTVLNKFGDFKQNKV